MVTTTQSTDASCPQLESWKQKMGLMERVLYSPSPPLFPPVLQSPVRGSEP
jgi:hypothetical protein